MGSIPESGRSPGGGHGNPLQYSCLENPTDRGAWRATVHGVTSMRTQLRDFNTHPCTQEALQGLGHQPLQARFARSHICSLHSFHKGLSLDRKAVLFLLPQLLASAALLVWHPFSRLYFLESSDFISNVTSSGGAFLIRSGPRSIISCTFSSTSISSVFRQQEQYVFYLHPQNLTTVPGLQ